MLLYLSAAISVLSVVSAAVLPTKTVFNDIPFAGVALSGKDLDAALRIYMPYNGSILELEADLTQTPFKWKQSSLISFPDAPVADKSPIAAAGDSTGVTRVYFYDTNGTLREQYADDWSEWKLGTLAVPVGSFGTKLTATTWEGTNDTTSASVWYTQKDGGLYEATHEEEDDWTINAVGHSYGPGGIMGKVWLEDDKVMKRVYFQNDLVDFQLRQSTWNVKASEAPDAWTTDAVSGFQFRPTGPMSFSGFANLGGDERVFVNRLDTNVAEYTRNGVGATFWKETPVILNNIQTRASSYMSACRANMNGLDYAFIFYTGLDGGLQYTWYTANDGWNEQNNVVAVFAS